jgi:hypothetical protein
MSANRSQRDASYPDGHRPEGGGTHDDHNDNPPSGGDDHNNNPPDNPPPAGDGGSDASPGLLDGLLNDGAIVTNLLGASGSIVDSPLGAGDVSGIVGSMLGSGDGKGLLGSLLNGQELGSATVNGDGSAGGAGDHSALTLDIGTSNSDTGGALVNVGVNTGPALAGAGDILSSELSQGVGGDGLGSVLDGHGLLNLNAGPASGEGDALVNVNTDPSSVLGGSENTLGSLLGNGDGSGSLGTLLNGDGLVSVVAGPGNSAGHALINVNADPGSAGNMLGNTPDMGLVAALAGQDGQHALGLPVADVPHDISLHEMPVADLHVHADHA